MINVVTTDDPAPLVEAMLADPRVRKLSFTGSTAVGRRLLELAAANVISTSMELGGNAPFLVLHDADLDLAVAGAMDAKMRNGGEACTAANRFLVHESVAEAFTQRLTAAMAAVRVGHGLEPRLAARPADQRGGARQGRAAGRRRGRSRRARAHGRRSALPGPATSTRRRCSTASPTAARSSPRRSSARSRR